MRGIELLDALVVVREEVRAERASGGGQTEHVTEDVIQEIVAMKGIA